MKKTNGRKIERFRKRWIDTSDKKWTVSDSVAGKYWLAYGKFGENFYPEDLAEYLNRANIKEIHVITDPGEDHSTLYNILVKNYKGHVWRY